ncbi:hypothetical protein AB0H83_21050 [Dactylosporangium sp. NPDC050688]|uniref:hypothetical protein n=1 Tax=Dactylosporangium sp. NPDC050688 TaxID=3157217 RepID=UPI0033DD0C59
MDDQLPCRLRVAGDVFDLAGPPAALRELAGRLRAAGDVFEQRIRNGALVQRRGGGAVQVELRGGPALHVSGSGDALAALWAALEVVADEAEADPDAEGPQPHRHVEALTVTAERPAAELVI